DFYKVVESCPLPLVIAGGPKLKTEMGALKMAESAIKEGAKGVDMGRNIWQSKQAIAMIQAIRSIVHENKSAESAFDLLNISKENK
ncbi:MAG: 3-hydroxy-5-phosphonooxypentane-2,4-dione thiolase LsrF, partial [Candidatus Omnitrophota bacterium]